MTDLKTENSSISIWQSSPGAPSRYCGRCQPLSVARFRPDLQGSSCCTGSQARLDLLPAEVIRLIILHLLESPVVDPPGSYRPVYRWKPITDVKAVKSLLKTCKMLKESVLSVVLCNVATRFLELEEQWSFVKINRKMAPADFAPFTDRPSEAETSFLGAPTSSQLWVSQF